MKSKVISERRTRTCIQCGDVITKQLSKAGKRFDATVYQDGHQLVVITKNGHVPEHRHS